MRDLHIRDLPHALLRRIEARAEAHGRSVGDEACALLEEALRSSPATAQPPTLEEIDRSRREGRP